MKKLKSLSVLAMIMIFAIKGIAAPPDAKFPAKNSQFKNYSAIHLAVAWDVSVYDADKPVLIALPQQIVKCTPQILAKEEDTGPVAINVNAITVDRNAALTYSADVTALNLKKQKAKANVSREDYRPTIVASVSNSNTSQKTRNIRMIDTAPATA